MERSWAYKILNRAAMAVVIARMIDMHTRKTFGYHYYLKYDDVVLLQSFLITLFCKLHFAASVSNRRYRRSVFIE